MTFPALPPAPRQRWSVDFAGGLSSFSVIVEAGSVIEAVSAALRSAQAAGAGPAVLFSTYAFVHLADTPPN